MQQYEIHIGKNDGDRHAYPCLQRNDQAAIRRAQSLVRNCETVEAWRAEVYVCARTATVQGNAHGNL